MGGGIFDRPDSVLYATGVGALSQWCCPSGRRWYHCTALRVGRSLIGWYNIGGDINMVQVINKWHLDLVLVIVIGSSDFLPLRND